MTNPNPEQRRRHFVDGTELYSFPATLIQKLDADEGDGTDEWRDWVRRQKAKRQT